jgi:hypothetical protein
MEAEAINWWSIIVNVAIGLWAILMLGIGFVLTQHIPEHTQQLTRIRATLDAINEKLDRG